MTKEPTVTTPHPLGVLIALVGAGFIGWGVWIGVPAAAALGALLLIGFVIDLIALLLLSPPNRTPSPPVAAPNPVQAGQPVTLWLYTASATRRGTSAGPLSMRCSARNPWYNEWLPADTYYLASPGVLGATVSLEAEHRGQACAGTARWVTDSPLRLWRARREVVGTAELTVWPQTAPLTVPPPRPVRSTGQGPMKAHLDDTTLREYAPGDDLRRVHWRSLARTNTLLTRAEEPEPLHRTVGALWVQPKADDNAAELGVALLTSWAEAMLNANQPFDLCLGATTLHQPNRAKVLETLTNLAATGGLAPTDEDADDGLLIAVPAGGQPVMASLPDIAQNQCTMVIAPTGWTGVPSVADALYLAADTPLDQAAQALETVLNAGAVAS